MQRRRRHESSIAGRINSHSAHRRCGRTRRSAPTFDSRPWMAMRMCPDKTLVLACGALAAEISTLVRLNGWDNLHVRYLPAVLHNAPDRIVEEMCMKLLDARGKYARIFAGYADCGTGGKLDAVLREFAVERLPGVHCYQFYSGSDLFSELVRNEIGSFFLTDFLVRTFDRVVIGGLGLDRYPELLRSYFANYRKLVYIAQTDDEDLKQKAESSAERLGLEYEYRFTGFGDLEGSLANLSVGK